MTWLAGWSDRKSHVINSASGAGTNYQIRVQVHAGSGSDSGTDVFCNGKCKTDFSDVRFTESDGNTTQTYFMEPTSGNVATFWVQVSDDLSAANSTIYIYYGNSFASTASNGAATFDFFDDFSSSPNGWTLNGCTINGGVLNIPANYGSWCYAQKTRPTGYNDYRFRFSGKCSATNFGWRAMSRGTGTYEAWPEFVMRDYYYSPLSNTWWGTQGYQTTGQIYPTRDSNWHTIELLKAGSNYIAKWDSLTPQTAIDATSETGTYIAFSGEPSLNGAAQVDWCFLAKYVNPEPSNGSWGNEEETIIVPYNGRHAGTGSKQTQINWSTGTTWIMQVESNVDPNNLSLLNGSAIIENLVIDGSDLDNQATGILLKDVYNCNIRNVTIKNCKIGIQVEISDDHWSHANRFEHIRLENVEQGIVFVGTESDHDFSYTTIDDVGILLSNTNEDHEDNVGIYIDSNANLLSAFIKATVWLDASEGTGMVVDGQLKLSLVNLEVEQANNTLEGRGLVVGQAEGSEADVHDNQSFLLTTGSIKYDPDAIPIVNNIYQTDNGGLLEGAPNFVFHWWL